MALLNRPVYVVEKDKLIYDSSHPIDAANVVVAITSGATGELKRGQIIDYSSGTYKVHAEGGEPSAIVAEAVSYAADETEVVATVYTSGTFRASEAVASPELTDADLEALRGKGIYLK
jgi:hypothetical protein